MCELQCMYFIIYLLCTVVLVCKLKSFSITFKLEVELVVAELEACISELLIYVLISISITVLLLVLSALHLLFYF